MRKFLHLRALAAAAVAVFGASSCSYYDPGYTIGGSYRGGRHGGSVSTSLFVSTGDSRWGYDPTCFAYYDHRRSCYYDPFARCYYPSGVRPVLIGRSHPHGWRPGRSHCPPPVNVRTIYAPSYRGSSTRGSLSHAAWSEPTRYLEPRPSRGFNAYPRSHEGPDSFRTYGPPHTDRYRSMERSRGPAPGYRESPRSTSERRGFSRAPSSYHTPVSTVTSPPAAPAPAAAAPDSPAAAAPSAPMPSRPSRPPGGRHGRS